MLEGPLKCIIWLRNDARGLKSRFCRSRTVLGCRTIDPSRILSESHSESAPNGLGTPSAHYSRNIRTVFEAIRFDDFDGLVDDVRHINLNTH